MAAVAATVAEVAATAAVAASTLSEVSVAEVAATAAVAASTLSEASVAEVASTAGTADAGLPNAAMAAPPVSAKPAMAAPPVSEKPEMEAPPVCAKTGTHPKHAATAGAMPQVPPVKKPQLSDTEVLDDKTVRLAAALRTKYRRGGGVVRIPVESVGFHPKNRDGQPPNGSRCAELFKDIFGVGFDAEESDNGGVVVEAKPGSTVLHDFNKKGVRRRSLQCARGDGVDLLWIAVALALAPVSPEHPRWRSVPRAGG